MTEDWTARRHEVFLLLGTPYAGYRYLPFGDTGYVRVDLVILSGPSTDRSMDDVQHCTAFEHAPDCPFRDADSLDDVLALLPFLVALRWMLLGR